MHVEAAGRGRRDRAGAEVLDLDRVGERDHRLARAREHHRQREREQDARRGASAWGRRHTYGPRDGESHKQIFSLGGHEVALSNPEKIYFPKAGITKRELVAVLPRGRGGRAARGRAAADDPQALRQRRRGRAVLSEARARRSARRASTSRRSRSRRAAAPTRSCVNNAAALVYVVNLGCIELHPHAVRAEDMDRPDELRIDLDPVPGVAWPQIIEVAKVAREVLGELGLVGWPKTSGSRGAHLWVRIEPRWTFAEVRRAALAFAREVERRAPAIATAKWWKEERRGVFLDYNQNARDRTTCCAYSVRARDDARVSMPLSWDDFLVARSGGVHAAHRAAHVRGAATRTRRSTTPARSTRCSSSRSPGAEGARRAVAAALREGRGRARRACAPEPTPRKPKLPVITIAQAKHKPDALAGLERWKARYPDVAAKLAPEDILVDTNRGRATAWYRVRINLRTCREAEHPPQEEPDPNYDPRTEYGRPTATSRSSEDLLELVRRRDLELIVAAVARRLVGPPALEVRRVAEPRALQWSYADLGARARCGSAPTTDPCRGSTGSSRRALRARASRSPATPPSPSTDGSRARPRAAARAARRAARASRLLERRRDADVMQHARVVVEPEQQRADERVLAALVPAEARDDAVRGARVLDLHHRALARQVGEVASAWPSTPSSPAPSKRWNQSCATARSRVAGVTCTRRLRAVASAASSRCAALRLRQRAQSSSPTASRSHATNDAGVSAASIFTRDAAGWMRSSSASKSRLAVGRDHDLAVEHAAVGQVSRSGTSSSGK